MKSVRLCMAPEADPEEKIPAVARDLVRRLVEDNRARAVAVEERERELAAIRKEEAPRLLERVGVSERERDLLAKGPDETPALNAVRAFLRGEERSLVLSGGTGVGKTVAAAWACLKALESRGAHGALFVTSAEAARRTASDYSRESSDLIDLMATVPLLVIDDVGTGAPPVWRSRLEEVINRRYGARRRLIITTNAVTAAGLNDALGERCLDRIQHEGRIVGLGKGSLRGAK